MPFGQRPKTSKNFGNQDQELWKWTICCESPFSTILSFTKKAAFVLHVMRQHLSKRCKQSCKSWVQDQVHTGSGRGVVLTVFPWENMTWSSIWFLRNEIDKQTNIHIPCWSNIVRYCCCAFQIFRKHNKSSRSRLRSPSWHKLGNNNRKQISIQKIKVDSQATNSWQANFQRLLWLLPISREPL